VKRVESLELRVECSEQALGLRAQIDTQHSTLNPRPFRGFTLIELLVVILIIAILASLILGVAAIAAESARENTTRHTVERLHLLLTEFNGTFKTRRVTLNSAITNPAGTGMIDKKGNWLPSQKGQAIAQARLCALREMMLMEMPDRWGDIALAPVSASPIPPIGDPLYLDAPAIQYNSSTWHRTELANVYLRRYQALTNRLNTITGVANTVADIEANQSAECLYMIITLACGDGEARAQFGESSIGDTDGDGAPEFLDGWGHPISFLRWAPGFDSPIELNANQLGPPNINNTTWTIAAAKDHDPFDVFRSDTLAFRLMPLIYSGGRDESAGLYDAPGHVTWAPKPNSLQATNSTPYFSPWLSPYNLANDSSTGTSYTAYLGTSMHLVDPNNDETSTDDVHNHLLGQR
jgi:prepilin-type N-terminal cleavage/methylation domain-containing protein